MWRAFPLIALAKASCYDYEYYDPGTGSSLPGNACAKQQATLAAGGAVAPAGQPALATSYAAPATAFSASTNFPATAFSANTFASATPVYTGATISSSSPIIGAAPVYGAYTNAGVSTTISAPTYGVAAPVYSSAPVAAPYSVAGPVYSSAPVATPYSVYSSAPVIAASTVYSPARVATTVVAPAAVTVGVQARSAAQAQPTADQSQKLAELQYYKDLGQRQAQQHKRNTRIVSQAAKDLSKSSLVNQLVAGSGNAAPFYPAVRLSYQKDVADAYRSEKKIASKNADDAYTRYQDDPSRLNLLVSKYQDLNADLRDAAYHYNVVNSGTFGQRIAANSLFGSVGGGLFGGLTQIITQRQQSNDLQDIQQQMQRVQRQIQAEVQQAAAAQKSTSAVSAQGSVQQRMMAMSVYGPQPQRG